MNDTNNTLRGERYLSFVRKIISEKMRNTKEYPLYLFVHLQYDPLSR